MKTFFTFLLSLGLALAADPQTDFASGTKTLSAEIYNQLTSDNDNFFISPFSIETLLALIQSGAKDETGAEIRASLHLPETQQETEDTIKNILPVLQDNAHLAGMIKIAGDESAINDDFKKVARDVYQARFVTTESQKGTFLSLDGSSGLRVINDLSFRGKWAVPFTSKNTKFWASEDEARDVSSLLSQGEFNYFESLELDAQILEVPLEGEAISVTFVLPNAVDGITSLENDMEKVLATPEFAKKMIQLQIPKFTIANVVDFKSILGKLGIQKVFDSAEADLSGIGGEKGDHFINEITQKTDISVDENGINAAIDTQIDGYKIDTDAAEKNFIIDHPFLFYIKIHDVIIFEGRVINP